MHALPLSDDMVTLDAARGVVHYSFFAEAEGNDAALEEAIVQHRAHYLAVKFGTGVLEPAVVPTLPRRRIDRRTFFGEFYDMDRDALILPAGSGEIITDWSSRRLGELSEYFRAGLDYWGVFLFTIFHPSTARLVVLSASTTD